MPCPDPECEETAEVRADKRGKLYVICPDCGRFTYNTLKGQERLRARLDALAQPAPEQVGGVTFGVVDDEPAQVDEPAQEQTEGNTGSGGLSPKVAAGLALGCLVVGGALWPKLKG